DRDGAVRAGRAARRRGRRLRLPDRAGVSGRARAAGSARDPRAAQLRVLGPAIVPTARRSRTIAAPVEELWEVIADPHHLPRWWPRVTRVEDVEGNAFTEVMRTAKGKLVRADFLLVRTDEA